MNYHTAFYIAKEIIDKIAEIDKTIPASMHALDQIAELLIKRDNHYFDTPTQEWIPNASSPPWAGAPRQKG